MFITAVCFTKPSIIIGIILEIYPKIAGSILCFFGEHNLSKPIWDRERREKRAGIGKREGGAGERWSCFSFLLSKGAFHLSELACRTSQLANETGFFQRVFLKNHLLRSHYLGFDWSGWIVLIKSEILITTGMVWSVSSGKWQGP